ncbi:MAG: hypothetical protein A2W26_01015 [Acidobacteria bacterium RBG_16_64_8]|nr:MAG: hypothetical protein A2W26_01015 [Acidobacteria bacterium RBG_16_64_8]
MTVWVAFAVNVGNLGQRFRPNMTDLVTDLNASFQRRGDGLQILDYFAQTGNFAIESSQSRERVSDLVSDELSTPCCVMSTASLETLIKEIRSLPSQPLEPLVRWTRCAVLHVSGVVAIGPVTATSRARFRVLSETAIAAWKRDRLDEGGRLDKRRRDGGWRALSRDISKQIGGLWTARSALTLSGIAGRARHPVLNA